jgi:DUF4097 and DUF4098 domain-containing protein YvlB
MKRITMATVVFAAAVAAPALAEDFRWEGRVAPGAAVEIKGVNGGIRATGASGDQVLVTAVKKARKSDPESVKVEAVEHDGGVTICAVYPSVDGRQNSCGPGDKGHMNVRDNDVSVEFEVHVPAGVRLAARTVNGGISATGLRADAKADTVNGAVTLESTGTAVANTVNGGITARMGRADWQGALRLNTVNGSIDVTLPASASTDVRAATVNGSIDTEFPLSVTGRISRRSLSGTIGSGGRQLELNTVNGGITLRKAGARTTAR